MERVTVTLCYPSPFPNSQITHQPCSPRSPNGILFFRLFNRGEIAKQRSKNEPISLGFTPRVEAKRRSRPSGSKIPQRGALLNRVHPAKFTSVTAKRISLGYPPGVQLGLNPQRQFNWGVFHWGAIYFLPLIRVLFL